MEKREPAREELYETIRTLQERLFEAEQTIEAIQSGEVDAFVVHKADGEQLYTLTGADYGYRVLVESISEGALILSSDDSIYYCNQTLGEMLGLPIQKIISRKLNAYIASVDREQTVGLIKVCRGSGAAKGELLMKRNDGTLLPVNVSLNCLRIEDFEGICAVVTDLSEQKQVEEELRRHRTELESLVSERTSDLSTINAELQREIIERKRAEETLRESEARFKLLSETAGRLLASADPQSVIDDMCTEVLKYLDCQAFFNFLVDETTGKLHLNACAGIPEEEARKIEWLDYGVAVCGCAARDGVRIVAEDIFNVNDVRTELVKSYGIQAYVCHPLMAQGRVIGTLSFGTKTRSHFSRRDLELMATVTEQVAVAMERVRLTGELERSRDELEVRVSIRTAELATANDELTEIERELRRSENRLRQNIELLQKVVDGITDPLFMLDKEGLVTTINKAAMDYFGATDATDCFGRPCFLGLRGREDACPGCSYPFSSVNKEPVTFERKGLVDSRKVESVTVYPVFNDFGERDAVIVKTSDVTQVKILERQIFHNEKLASLGLIASGIAHEINNPSSFIHFNIPILKQYLDELMPILDDYAALHPDLEVLHMSYAELKEDIYRLLENMAHGSQRINMIVGTLKCFVGKRDAEGLQKIDLKQLIDKVLALCHAEIRRTVKSFDLLAPGDLPPIVCDPEALEQVLVNLLINAVHACDKKDSRMSLKVGRGYLGSDDFFIEVSDNGSGIEETIRDRIFDPFFTTKSGSMGTGLGLYICHHHVTSMGGRIEVESRVGEGSTFRVLLPQANEE